MTKRLAIALVAVAAALVGLGAGHPASASDPITLEVNGSTTTPQTAERQSVVNFDATGPWVAGATVVLVDYSDCDGAEDTNSHNFTTVGAGTANISIFVDDNCTHTYYASYSPGDSPVLASNSIVVTYTNPPVTLEADGSATSPRTVDRQTTLHFHATGPWHTGGSVWLNDVKNCDGTITYDHYLFATAGTVGDGTADTPMPNDDNCTHTYTASYKINEGWNLTSNEIAVTYTPIHLKVNGSTDTPQTAPNKSTVTFDATGPWSAGDTVILVDSRDCNGIEDTNSNTFNSFGTVADGTATGSFVENGTCTHTYYVSYDTPEVISNSIAVTFTNPPVILKINGSTTSPQTALRKTNVTFSATGPWAVGDFVGLADDKLCGPSLVPDYQDFSAIGTVGDGTASATFQVDDDCTHNYSVTVSGEPPSNTIVVNFTSTEVTTTTTGPEVTTTTEPQGTTTTAPEATTTTAPESTTTTEPESTTTTEPESTTTTEPDTTSTTEPETTTSTTEPESTSTTSTTEPETSSSSTPLAPSTTIRPSGSVSPASTDAQPPSSAGSSASAQTSSLAATGVSLAIPTLGAIMCMIVGSAILVARRRRTL